MKHALGTTNICSTLAIVLSSVASLQCSSSKPASDDVSVSRQAQNSQKPTTTADKSDATPAIAAAGATAPPQVALGTGRGTHAPGQLIVKVRSRKAGAAGQSASTPASVAEELDTAIASFAGFRGRHRLRHVEHLFDEHDPSGRVTAVASGAAFDEHVASVKSRFASRTQRATAGHVAPRLDNVYTLHLDDSKADLEKAAQELRADPNVEYAIPNALAHTSYVPSDPLYGQQWSHKMTSAEAAWNIEKGKSSVVVAVVDTGVDYKHEDLQANMLGACTGGCPTGTGYDFTDVDTASYIADGWQLIAGEDYVTPDADPSDFNGHGTHVAGIVAARADNGVGVSGVAPGVRLMPVRTGFSMTAPWGQELGSLEMDDVARAIRYAADNGADVISMSFGGPDSPVLRDAIAYANGLGAVLVAAAGNDASSVAAYPAAYDGVIAVAATNGADARSSYSNFGAWVDVAAPGGDTVDGGILSTVPRSGGELSDPSGYRLASGTSMAAPYISGVAALVLSRDPSRKADKVASIIRQSADRSISTEYVGMGRVNVFAAVQRPTPQVRIAIDAPSDGVRISGGTLALTGSIDAPGATTYRLSYGTGVYPTSFTSFGSGNAPTSHTQLGTLNTAALSDEQIYTLQVEVTDGAQTMRERTHVFLSKGMHAGFPQNIAPPLSTGFLSWGNAASLADITGQGRQAIFIGGNNGIFAFGGDGSTLPGWPQSANGNMATNGETPSPAIGDLDGDGEMEVVAGLGGSVYAWRAKTGLLVPGFPVTLSGPQPLTTVSPVLLSDLDGDGKLEIIVKVVDWSNSGVSYDRIEVLTAAGVPFRAWPYRFDLDHGNNPGFGGMYLALTAVDTNGDGKKELVALVENGTLLQPTLYVWNYDGSLVSGFPRELPDARVPLGQGTGQSPVVTDIDGDGQVEVGFFIGMGNCYTGGGQFIYKNLDGTTVPGWPAAFRNQVTGTNASLADLDGDGSLETIFATTGGCPNQSYTIEAFKKDGTIFPGFPVYVNEPMNSQVAVADLDGDGLPEVIATTGSGAVHAFSRTGVELSGFPKFAGVPGFTPASVPSCPAVGDVDGDGKADLVATTSGGSVAVWALAGSVAKGKADWPMSLHDPRHSMTGGTTTNPPQSLATLRFTTTWNTGYCAEVTVKNSQPRTTTSWSVDFDLHQSTLQNLWNASYTHIGSRYTARSLSYNGQLTQGQSTVFGFCGNKTGSNWTPVVTGTTLQ